MDFQIGFAILLVALSIINISPYSALIFTLVSMLMPLANWNDFWLMSVVSLVFAFIFRAINPRR
jgi:ABC-type amino acid transport system permease subunit